MSLHVALYVAAVLVCSSYSTNNGVPSMYCAGGSYEVKRGKSP